MIKPLIIAFALLGLSACASNTPDSAKADHSTAQAYAHCLSSKHMIDMHRACFGIASKNFNDVQRAGAKKHWSDFLKTLDVDHRLMASVLSNRVDLAQTAISSGADVNRVFTTAELMGRGSSKTTPLMKAGTQLHLEMFELLLKNGANPSWKKGGEYFDVVVNVIGRGSTRYSADGSRSVISGLEFAELAYQYGYRPDGRAIEAIESASKLKIDERQGLANLKPYLSKVISSASPQAIREYEALKAREAQAEQKRRSNALDRNAQAQTHDHQSITKMRSIGARICADKPGFNGVVTYVGYVENLAPEKVQIRVSNAHFKDAPSLRPGGFEPTIIWDSLRGWRSCE